MEQSGRVKPSATLAVSSENSPMTAEQLLIRDSLVSAMAGQSLVAACAPGR
jgi:hypothetical protein